MKIIVENLSGSDVFMKYKVGDKVVIKAWDDMVMEYGYVEKDDVIPCDGYFDGSMKPFCGTVQEIESIYFGFYIMEGSTHCFSEDMIKGLKGVEPYYVNRGEIWNVILKGECIAVEKDTNKVYGCTELDCSRCLFGGEEVDCVGARKEWFAKMFGENKNG